MNCWTANVPSNNIGHFREAFIVITWIFIIRRTFFLFLFLHTYQSIFNLIGKFKMQIYLMSLTWDIQTTQLEDHQDPFVSRCVRAPQHNMKSVKAKPLQQDKFKKKSHQSIYSAKTLCNTRKCIHKLHGSFGMYLCPNTLGNNSVLLKSWML